MRACGVVAALAVQALTISVTGHRGPHRITA